MRGRAARARSSAGAGESAISSTSSAFSPPLWLSAAEPCRGLVAEEESHPVCRTPVAMAPRGRQASPRAGTLLGENEPSHRSKVARSGLWCTVAIEESQDGYTFS